MILRLTLHSGDTPVDDEDLYLDADLIYAVLRDTAKSTGEPIALVHCRTGTYFLVKDPRRDVQARWAAASGMMEEPA